MGMHLVLVWYEFFIFYLRVTMKEREDSILRCFHKKHEEMVSIATQILA